MDKLLKVGIFFFSMEGWLLLVLQALYFFLPVYLANMAPELVGWIPWKKSVWEKGLGKNKTWRGVIVAVVVGGLVFYVQKLLYSFGFFNQLSIIDYSDFSIVLGLLMGIGAMVGDMGESYFKRKLGLKPGESWKPWDQLDFVIGGLLLGMFVYVPPVSIMAVLLIVSPVLHILANRIGYWLKIHDTKW